MYILPAVIIMDVRLSIYVYICTVCKGVMLNWCNSQIINNAITKQKKHCPVETKIQIKNPHIKFL